MSSTSKGNKLEDNLHAYLLGQQSRGELVFDAHPPQSCKIFKKKKYYDKNRKAYIEFDVVVEVYRLGRSTPHLFVIFECKNYEGSVPEIYVNDFLIKIGRVFGSAAKGVFVVSSRLQSGAENVARSGGIGIVKYDERGLEVVADRKGYYQENRFVEAQIFQNANPAKSLKFSAYYNGAFFGRIDHFLRGLDGENSAPKTERFTSVPYVRSEHIKSLARELLEKNGYAGGPVDLSKICSGLSISLIFSNECIHDVDGRAILGTANFGRRLIEINEHANGNQERFTLGHEIGHFCLQHDRYLRSEAVVAEDFFIDSDKSFNYERLEFQANVFASNLILPDDFFEKKAADCRRSIGIRDRGHGYIFVDDQPCNDATYRQLLLELSCHFEASKTAVEIKLKNMGMLKDQRTWNGSALPRTLGNIVTAARL